METNKKPKYRVHVWQADEDNTETVFEAPAKPTLEQLYKLIGCRMVERVSGYDKSVSNRTFDIWIDEEGKFNSPVKNLRATNAWYRWMHRTGHVNIPGDYITGTTVCYKKMYQSQVVAALRAATAATTTSCGAPFGRAASRP